MQDVAAVATIVLIVSACAVPIWKGETVKSVLTRATGVVNKLIADKTVTAVGVASAVSTTATVPMFFARGYTWLVLAITGAGLAGAATVGGLALRSSAVLPTMPKVHVLPKVL